MVIFTKEALAKKKRSHMKTKIPLMALASFLLLCATSIPTHASTSGMFEIQAQQLNMYILNTGGPNIGPISVAVSVVEADGTIFGGPFTVTAMPGKAAEIAFAKSDTDIVRIVVNVLGDQKLRLFIKPTVEVRTESTDPLTGEKTEGDLVLYIPSTEFIP